MQEALRVEEYSHLKEYVQNRAHDESIRRGAEVHPGKIVILPSSFSGSPRHMKRRYYEAMSVVRENGHPDFFITMTCNPDWPEIRNSLNPDQHPSDRPDLIVRVFMLKLRALLHDLIEGQFFGPAKACFWVIEFQKRGLPHAHITLTLKNEEDKPTTPSKIDRVVSTFIPDPQEEPQLYETVMKSMIHGPCGDLNPQCPCMKDGKCRFNYPKFFCDETELNEKSGYPIYRRPSNSRRATVRRNHTQFTVDTRNVVPYNPVLLLKYNCHINVEVANSIKCIKYLYKYILKGSDMIETLIVPERDESNSDRIEMAYDEVKAYQNARYMTAYEAAWRLFENEMNGCSHSVELLPLHLPNHEQVVFQEGLHAQAVQNGPPETKLTAYFALNSRPNLSSEETALLNTLHYHEFPKHYTFSTKEKMWIRRTRRVRTEISSFRREKPVIGNVPSTSPKRMELYCLRTLLRHKTRPRSFDDLKTDSTGRRHDTFQACAVANGLLLADNHWELTLLEAVLVETNLAKIRDLFVTVLYHGCPPNPYQLWEQFKCEMISVPRELQLGSREYNIVQENLLHSLYHKLNSMLKDIDSSLDLTADYHIPRPPEHSNPSENLDPDEAAQDLQMHVHRFNTNLPRLNPAQQAAYQAITDTLASGRPGTFFIDGPGGSGKSFLYSTLISYAIINNFKPLVMATTGIAASQIGGITIHRAFSVPIPCTEESVSYLRTQSVEAQKLKNNHIFFIDEITQCPKQVFELIDRFLRDVTGNRHIPFGGKIIVVGGDFRQCLPVLPSASSAQILHATVKSSSLWPLFSENTFHLTTNQRSENQQFSDWLMDIGNGTVETVNLAHTPINIVHTVDDLIQAVYGNSLTLENLHTFHSTMIISPKNKQVNEINNKVLNMIDTYTEQFLSINEPIMDGNHPVVPEEIIETLQPAGIPPHNLIVKLGACYMLLRNLNLKRGLCNGSRIVITSIGQRIIQYDLLHPNGTVRDSNIILPRITLTPSENYPFMFKRTQYPIVPAYAASIHKVQGCSLKKQGINLLEPMFTHGQLYVALSRAPNFDNITVLVEHNQNTVRNEVWTSILQSHQIPPNNDLPPLEGDIFPTDQPVHEIEPNLAFLNDDFLAFYSGGTNVNWSYIDNLDQNPE